MTWISRPSRQPTARSTRTPRSWASGRAAEGRGITYVQDRVVGLDVAGGLVSRAHLAGGGALPVDTVVNVANCWAAGICDMVGMGVPIVPRQRQQFFFDTKADIEPIPAMRHASGHGMRRLSAGFLAGYSQPGMAPGFNWELDHAAFDDVVWPRLAGQSSAFEAIKMRSGWVGHYDMNLLDGNPVIDRAPAAGNFILAAGFSGHGLQHAPAIGRAVKEMILDGGFRSIDLSRFNYRRIVENDPLPDAGPRRLTHGPRSRREGAPWHDAGKAAPNSPTPSVG